MSSKVVTKIVVILLFYISPIIDNLYGYLYYQMNIVLPVAVVFRSTIILLIFYILRRNHFFIRCIIITVPSLVLLTFLWSALYYTDPLFELNILIRLLFIPLVVLFFNKANKFYPREKLWQFVADYGLIISLIIILCFIFGVGNHSYGGVDGNFGFGIKGYFKAVNDLGLTLVLSLLISFAYYSKYSNNRWNLGRCLLIALSGIMIGSRVGIILSSTFIVSFIIYYVFWQKKSNLLIRFFAGLLFASFAVWFGSYIYSKLDTYALAKFEMENIEDARTGLIDAAKEHIDDFDELSFVIGKGYRPLATKVARYTGYDGDEKGVEADWFEIIGSYGYVVGHIIVLFYLYMSFASFMVFVKLKNMDNFLIFADLSLFCLIGYLAGHAVQNTLVSPVYGVLASITLANKREIIIERVKHVRRSKMSKNAI